MLAVVAVIVALAIRAQYHPVTVIVAGDALQTTSRAANVSDLLQDLNIQLSPHDAISPPPETPLTDDLVVRVDPARSVTLTIDGETRLYVTPLTNPADILASVPLEVGPDDRISIDGTDTRAQELAQWPVPVNSIALQRAQSVEIIEDGEARRLVTTGGTVGEALFDAGVTLYLADTVSPDTNSPLEPDMQITILRSQPVSIIADGETVQTRSQGSTVADALADAGVALVGLDYSLPGEEVGLLPGMHIRVIRVREEIVTETSPLPYETLYQADSNTELDQTSLLQSGREGVQENRYRVRYENGFEVGRELEQSTVVEEPQNHIIGYGTQIVLRTVDTPEGPREYWRVLEMYATSYHPAALGGDSVTATGRHLEKGVVAINPNIIPYGTQVFVPNYGVGIAADTGGPRRTPYWIDLGYSDSDFESWSRTVQVYLLTPVPPEIDYVLP